MLQELHSGLSMFLLLSKNVSTVCIKTYLSHWKRFVFHGLLFGTIFSLLTSFPLHTGQVQMAGKTTAQLKELLLYRKKDRGSVTAIATRLGQYKETVTPEWLILTDKDKMPKAEIVAFPKPPSAPGK